MTTFPQHWHPVVEITQLGRHGIENRESRKIVLGTHSGTHCDAPSHFIPEAQTVDKISLTTLVGPATVINFSNSNQLRQVEIKDISDALGGDDVPERLILRFDWSDKWGTMEYYNDHPFLSDSAAQWLVDNGLLLLGMDTPMPDSPLNGWTSSNDSPIHKILLGNGVILLEYLCNLRSLKQNKFDLVALPLKIKDGDGSPIRCIGIERNS